MKHLPRKSDAEVLAIYESLLIMHPELSCTKQALYGAYLILCDTYMNGNKLLICGNGGSAADAGHIVGELMKGFNKKRVIPEADQIAIKMQCDLYNMLEKAKEPVEFIQSSNTTYDPAGLLQGALPAIDLTQHQALSTAFANDISPIFVFAQQVYGYGEPGDTLLAISTSGNAENCRFAAMTAKAKNMRVISLTGPDGGQLALIADCSIKTPGETTARVQEYHLPVYHTLCAMLEEKFY